MTDQVKKAYELLKTVDEGDDNNNISYAMLHEDGHITPSGRVMCWANIYAGFDVVENSAHAQRLRHECGEYPTYRECGWVLTPSPVHGLIFNVTPCDKSLMQDSRYLWAVQTWLSMFELGLVSDTLQNRLENGVHVDFKNGRLTKEQFGTLLVGFRNLGEQRRYQIFTRLCEEGLSPQRAALWTLLFEGSREENTWNPSRGHHTVLASTLNYDLEWVKKCLDNNPYFFPEATTEPHGSLDDSGMSWELYAATAHSPKTGKELRTLLNQLSTKKVTDWGDTVYLLSPDTAVNFILEHTNG